ncbi:MAG: cytidylyltransferase domain-containing protein [Lachnospiraceae bacterium]
MKNDYNMVAMIPARLGSKRIPRKNIRYLEEKPLIQYPIDLCKQSNMFSSIWVNTESEELGNVSERLGVNFHRRPAELSTDTATNREFVYEFLTKHDCDYVVMVNTTSPLLRKETMENFIQFINENSYDTVLSVVSEKEETFYQGSPLNFSLKEKVNSQFLTPVEKIVWSMTAWKKETFLKLQDAGQNPVFGGKIGLFSIPKDEACDLDTEEDWRIAEGILASRKITKEERYMEL